MKIRKLAVALLLTFPVLALPVLALPAGAFAQTPAAAPGQPGWTPAGNDCFIWNRTPQSDESATWSGPCKNEHADGRGTLVWQFGDATQRYEGDMRDGRLNGQGTYEFTLSSRYEGGFKDDDFDGKGTMIEPGVRYEGMWRAGKKNGRGLLTTLNGDRYEGEFKDEAITGRGTLTLSDGRKYDGLMLDGKPNGQGTLTEPSGIYAGIWKNGCFADGARRAAFGTNPTSCP